jgi:AraC family transcriptional regulator, chitin signaling transcriptional activator
MILKRKVFFNLKISLQKWQIALPLLLAISVSSNLQANDFSSINKLANISKIIQDKQGFIWFAGQQGLTRFDGNTSITFSSNNKQWPLPFTWLHDVSSDGDHLLLATEANGLWQFDPKTGKTKALLAEIAHKSIYDISVFKNYYYLNFMDSLYRYDPSSGITILIKKNINIRQIVHTKQYLYISSKSGLLKLSQDGKQLTTVLTEPIQAITALSSYVIAVSAKKIYSISDNGEVNNIDVKHKIYALTNENRTKNKTNNNVQENFFAVNNQGEIEKFSASKLNKLSHNFPTFKVSHIRNILHDSSGVLWLISNNGIFQLNENTLKNTTKVFDITINANKITTIDNNIVIGSYGIGLQNFTAPVFDSNINNVFTKNALRITDLVVVDNILFIATFDGLWRYNLATKKVNRVDFADNNKLLLKFTYKHNKLYLASNYNGFYIYDLRQEKITDHVSLNDGLSSNEVIDILPLDNGDVWLATTKGLDIYYGTSRTVKNVGVAGPNKVVSVLQADNKVFATTLGDGIFVYNFQGQLLSRFAEGIRFNYMTLINNEIWITARPGLYRLDPKTQHLTMVPNTEKYSFVGSSVVLEDKLYSSHFNGILTVPLEVQTPFNAKVFISKTTISGKSYLLNKSITVASLNEVITLSLASLDYRAGQEKKYQYRINNGNWNSINDDQLTLTGLASGLYNIEIMATNSLGQWSANKAFTEINVAYPWYWTPQIRLVYLMLFLAISAYIFWLLYLRTKSITRIHQLLTSDIKTRGRIALNVTHNLNLVQEQLTQKNYAKATNLIEQSINELTNSSQHQEPSILYGKSLIIALDYLSDYAHKKYHINISSQIEILEELLNDDIKADLYKIIYEAVTSATLNGSGRNFTISLKEYRNKLWLKIQDDANSFTNFTNKINFNIAMYYIRQIASKHNASINAYDEDVNGSQLLISIPLLKTFIEKP